MTVLVVGSVALDSVETPFGTATDVIGGSATYFAAAAAAFTPVQLLGVVGRDYPLDRLRPLEARGVDLSGLTRADGPSFRWHGRYGHDLNVAETLETQLGVFADFQPTIPVAFRRTPFVFLANIDPRLQLGVLAQMESPRLVACDTMNFWIQSRRADLLTLLGRVDLVMLNDGEARQLSERVNLVQSARWILDRGPRHVIIKQGEHGAFLFTRRAGAPDVLAMFFAPAYPLEEMLDPTGAGDSFAGGFMGHLAATGDLSESNLRRAVVIGCAMGSFAVERFSTAGLAEATPDRIARRVREFQQLVALDSAPPDGAAP